MRILKEGRAILRLGLAVSVLLLGGGRLTAELWLALAVVDTRVLSHIQVDSLWMHQQSTQWQDAAKRLDIDETTWGKIKELFR